MAAIVTKFIEDYDKDVKVEWFPSLLMDTTLLNIRWFIEHNHQFYSDRNLLQRLLLEWKTDQRNAYIHDLLRGASQKDTIILAEIKPIIEYLKKNDGTKENIEYFQCLFDKDYRFLVIDGQHRIVEIKKFFHLNELKKDEEAWRTKEGAPFRDFVINGDVAYDLNGGFFQEWPEAIRETILEKVNIVTSVIQSGDIKELKLLFVGANSGNPMSEFEKLIVESWSVAQRYLVDLSNPEKQSEHIINLTNKFSKFSDKYSPEKKGLSYCFAEMLVYLESDYGQNTTIPLHKTIKGVETILKDKYVPKPKNIKNHRNFINTIANGLVPMKKSTALSRVSLCNAFMTLSLLHDPNHFRRYKSDLPELRVKDAVRFMVWFCKTETVRIEENRYQTDSKGNVRYKNDTRKKGPLKNDHCYSGYLKTVWGKVHLEFRETKILEDLLKDYKQLCNEGVLVEAGKAVSNPAERRATLAALSNWTTKEGKKLKVFDVLESGSKYDVGHIVHKSDGGDNSIENTQLEFASANRSKGNN